MTACKVCGRPAVGRGLCNNHYQQAWKRNDFRGQKTKSETVTLKDRLLDKITVTPSGCWEWKGSRRIDKFAYGVIWFGGRMRRAHRASYEVHKGPIPRGLDVLHECDFPPCINPDHLFLGTRGQNNTDSTQKGRNAKGEMHGMHKLTIAEVKAIRTSSLTHKELAKMYGVNSSVISTIRAGKAWKHI